MLQLKMLTSHQQPWVEVCENLCYLYTVYSAAGHALSSWVSLCSLLSRCFPLGLVSLLFTLSLPQTEKLQFI